MDNEEIQGVKFSEFPSQTPSNSDEVVGLHSGDNARFTIANIIAAVRQGLASIFVPKSDVGAAGGVASLDSNGKVPSGQLPSSTGPEPATATPLMDGTGAVGTSTKYAREDHEHPADTNKQSKITANGILKGDGAGGVSAATPGTDYATPEDLEILASIADGTYQGTNLATKYATEIASYGNDPWAWIKARITDGNYTGIHVGDYIPFVANNLTYSAQIAGINTYTDYGDAGHVVGNHIDFISRELWISPHQMHKVGFNNGTKFGSAPATEYPWLASDLYLYLNSLSGMIPSQLTPGGGSGYSVDYTSGGVYAYLPDSLKAVIVQKRLMLPKRFTQGVLLNDDNGFDWTDIGKLWIPSETEVYGHHVWGGRNGYSLGGMPVQYPIFDGDMKKRVKKLGVNRYTWWLLSAHGSVNSYWCCVYGYGAAISSASTDTTVSAPICFRIA